MAQHSIIGLVSNQARVNLLRYAPLFLKKAIPIVQYAYKSKTINTQLSKLVKHHKQQRTLFIVGGVLFAAGVFLLISSVEPTKDGIRHHSNSLGSQIGRDLREGFRTGGPLALGSRPVPMLSIGSSQLDKRNKAAAEAKRLVE